VIERGKGKKSKCERGSCFRTEAGGKKKGEGKSNTLERDCANCRGTKKKKEKKRKTYFKESKVLGEEDCLLGNWFSRG